MNLPVLARAAGLFVLVGSLLLTAPVSPAAGAGDPVDAAGADAITLPVPLSGIVAVSNYVNTCAVTTGGGVKCWGDNQWGQLGNGDAPNDSSVPVAVAGLDSGVAAVSTGFHHTCAVTTGGGVKCWGDNLYGQLGNSDAPNGSDVPVDVTGLGSGVAAVSAGSYHTCVLTTGGGVKCWGRNIDGQLGNNDAPNESDVPVDVIGLDSGVAAVSAGFFHTCALITGGGVKCWGDNSQSQLGNAKITGNSGVPVTVAGLSDAATIDVGGAHTCAVTAEGFLKCWGDNEDGQLGNNHAPDDSDTPVIVSALGKNAAAVSAGGYQTCALTTGGGAKCWGDNLYGQLGNDDAPNDSYVPVDVIGLSSGVKSISAGSQTACALTAEGGVTCWGHNDTGQLGDTTTLNRAFPGYVLIPSTCYALTATHSGDGGDPSATPLQSPGCPPSHYLYGTPVVVSAAPNANRYVRSWTGTVNDASRDLVNLVTVPLADTTVSVTYGVCRALTLAHSGDGGNPLAVPGQSGRCPANTYAAGDKITLIAAPGTDQRVKSWANADQTPAVGNLVNALTMPDAAATVTAAYEPCFQLSATTSGQGDPIAASPVASYGCAAGTYVTGQSIVLSAAPASGWSIDGWSGTADDSTTAGTNTLTMPADNATVGVTYLANPTTGTVAGTVVDETGKGVAGAEVTLSDETATVSAAGPATPDLTRTEITDANGDYRFEGVPTGAYVLSVAVDGVQLGTPQPVSVGAGETISLDPVVLHDTPNGALYLPAVTSGS